MSTKDHMLKNTMSVKGTVYLKNIISIKLIICYKTMFIKTIYT